MKPGDIATIQPCDNADALAVELAGERVKVLQIREGIVSAHVYVVLAEPIPGKAYRAVFREQDLRVE